MIEHAFVHPEQSINQSKKTPINHISLKYEQSIPKKRGGCESLNFRPILIILDIFDIYQKCLL